MEVVFPTCLAPVSKTTLLCFSAFFKIFSICLFKYILIYLWLNWSQLHFSQIIHKCQNISENQSKSNLFCFYYSYWALAHKFSMSILKNIKNKHIRSLKISQNLMLLLEKQQTIRINFIILKS